MAKSMANLSTFSLTQLLCEEYWDIEDSEFRRALNAGDVGVLVNWIVSMLETDRQTGAPTGWQVLEAYGIIHDKDTREVWDDSLLKAVTEVKKPHIHASFKFVRGANEGANVHSIADRIGLGHNYVERPKAGRYAWDNQLAYLIHAKDKDKYQYQPQEVYTYSGLDYLNIYAEARDRWERGAVKKQSAQAVEDVDWLESEILQGRITKSQLILTDEYYRIYALYKRRLDDAFDTYGQRKMYRALERLENGDIRTSVYYVMGKPGSGKTSFAVDLSRRVQERAKEEYGEDWTVCKSASTNPVDDYQGEEILLMDDVRGSSMRADDWLKLLDPWNASPSSARYRNKMVVANVIIITATIPPAEFFYYAKGVGQGSAQAEAVDQFLRRLLAIVEVIDVDHIRALRARKLPDGKYHMMEIGRNSHGMRIATKSEYDLIAYQGERFRSISDASDFFADEVISHNRLAKPKQGG